MVSPSPFTVPTVEARQGERDGHAPNGKQKDRCHACGRRSRENPTPNAYPEARREEILHASQECEPLAWPEEHVCGLSGHCVELDQKKELSFLPSGPPWWPPAQRMPRPRRWNSMSCGRLCSKKPTTPGSHELRNEVLACSEQT